MRWNLCGEFLIHADQDKLAEVGNSPPQVVQWIEKQDFPTPLVWLLRGYWPQKTPLYIRHLAFQTAEAIQKDCWQDECLRQRLLTIGWAPNGDYLAIRLDREPAEVGFISHEEWDHQSDYRPYYQPIAKSLESLLYRLIENRFVPRDYWVAKDYNSLLEEERTS